MIVDINQIVASISVAGSIITSIWVVGDKLATKLGHALNYYAEKQTDALNAQRDIQELVGKHEHLRGKHQQLDCNMNSELQDVDERFQKLEAQVNQLVGILQARRAGD